MFFTLKEALQKAKLEYIDLAEGVAGHPAFWSPFIQFGDSKPIHVARKNPWLLYGATVALLLLLGGFFVLKRRNS